MVTYTSKLVLGTADLRIRLCLDPEEMNRGVGMIEAGLSQRHVAGVLVVLQSTVARTWERFRTTEISGIGMVVVVRGSHLGIKTDLHVFSLFKARRQCFVTATALQNDLQNATGVRISTQTIRNRLNRADMRARQPVIRIPLTQNHVQVRLQRVRAHVRWLLNDWTPTLFTDNSRYCVDFT